MQNREEGRDFLQPLLHTCIGSPTLSASPPQGHMLESMSLHCPLPLTQRAWFTGGVTPGAVHPEGLDACGDHPLGIL